jgi:threonine/homoserine/homoserine lactone efflux protein
LEFSHWLSLFSICLLGAMSPGPSLAVVLKSSLGDSHRAGYITAIAHGAGVGLYGLLTVTGLAVLITRSPVLFLAIQLFGGVYLIYLGVNSLRSSGSPNLKSEIDSGNRNAALRGFLVAFLNPKLAVFMLALFSQFLNPEAKALEKGIMVATVGITDACWYSLVVALVSRKAFLKKLQRSAQLIDRVFGIILIVLALSVLLRALMQI